MVTQVVHGFDEWNKQRNKWQIVNFLDDKNILAYIKLVKRNKTYNKLNINFEYLLYCQFTV